VVLRESPDVVGQLIAGRYQVEEEIGRGGMATVYRARDLRHDAMVAIKVLRPELAALIGGERFAREIRITAQLQHPGIVAVFDSGAHAGIPFYVMPYVRGETLAARVTREGMLGVEEAVRVTCEVARALAYAHRLGFVHRDVKPSNILLSQDRAMLGDFGVARAVTATAGESITSSGIAVGTASYMSPEQAASGHLDQRSDVYSLGCVLYELLAGTPPFTGPVQVVLARHSIDSAPRLRTARPSIPAALEAAVSRAMSKVPGDRYPDADAFAAALETALAAPSAADDAVAPVRPATRRRRLAIAAGLVAVAALGATGLRVMANRTNPLDARRVMVFPLTVPAGYTGPASIGEDAGTIIGSALDGIEPLRWIDAWPLLTASQRANPGTITTAEMHALARQRRSRYVITGRLAQVGDSTAVRLSLYDVREPALPPETGSATGPGAEVWRHALRAVNRLLPRLITGAASLRDVEQDWKDRPPAAVASFLLGEGAFRRLNLDEALGHFRRAVGADSAFAMASFRGSQAATWLHRSSEAAAFLGGAASLALPPRYAQFAAGYRHYLAGRADSAAAGLRRAIALDPEMGVAWMQLGEVYTHLLPRGGNVDSLAAEALARAHQLDPDAAPVLFHLIEGRLRRGPLAGTDSLLRAFLSANPDTMLAGQVEIMHRCAAGGAASVDWHRVAATRPGPLLYAGIAFAGGGARPECAQPAFAALLSVDTAAGNEADARRYFALIGLEAVLVMRGRVADAVAQVDSFIVRWKYGTSVFLLSASLVDSMRARAVAVARGDSAASGPAYRGMRFSTRLWLLGQLEVIGGRRAVAEGVARELERRADSSGAAKDALMARSLRARIALGLADTARALASFEAIVPGAVATDALRWDEVTPLGGERLSLARLLFAAGAYQRAIDVADVFESAWPVVHLLYVPESLRLRADAATALGDEALARRYRERLAALQDGGDSGGT
jgi:tRNA A-37 threonylcarbamoyl transferase component Bud32/tetratricopeptide (TPR) repeat protein